MKVITKKEFLENEEFYFEEIKGGKIFVYPTDTIYGIGCDAANSLAVKKIRKIKNRDSKPFSIIIPRKDWILDNCFVSEECFEFLEKLPGKFTLIFKLKNGSEIAKQSLIGDLDSIGVRIPDNWFAQWLAKMNLVFVTTSVNLSGEKPITEIGELKKEIYNKVDYVIDSGVLDNKPSQVINLSRGKAEILRK
jgi:L-threonylcarbamoyladenylate synthase